MKQSCIVFITFNIRNLYKIFKADFLSDLPRDGSVFLAYMAY